MWACSWHCCDVTAEGTQKPKIHWQLRNVDFPMGFWVGLTILKIFSAIASKYVVSISRPLPPQAGGRERMREIDGIEIERMREIERCREVVRKGKRDLAFCS